MARRVHPRLLVSAAGQRGGRLTAPGKMTQKLTNAGKIAVAVGGGIVIAGLATLATLALTHDTAVRENFAAYGNGIGDTLDAVRNGDIDPFDFYEPFDF